MTLGHVLRVMRFTNKGEHVGHRDNNVSNHDVALLAPCPCGLPRIVGQVE